MKSVLLALVALGGSCGFAAVATQKFMTLTHNLSNDSSYLVAPEDMHWFALIQFSDDGYVKDDEKIDANAILASIKKNTEAGNATRRGKGW